MRLQDRTHEQGKVGEVGFASTEYFGDDAAMDWDGSDNNDDDLDADSDSGTETDD